MVKYHKLHRGACLSLFVISSVYSLFHYHTNAVAIAGLSLIGVIAYDVVCYFKDKSKQIDYSADIASIKASQEDLATKVGDIRNDASIGKLAEAFKRK